MTRDQGWNPAEAADAAGDTFAGSVEYAGPAGHSPLEFVPAALRPTPRPVAAPQGQGVGRLWRKKPVVIEAVHFDGTNHDEAVRFVGTAATVTGRTRELHIKTLEGLMHVSPGDWIIRGVRGEFYPCKPDIFADTYDPEAAAPAAPRQEGQTCESAPDWCGTCALCADRMEREATEQAMADRVFAAGVLDPNDGDVDSSDPADWIIAAAERMKDRHEEPTPSVPGDVGAALREVLVSAVVWGVKLVRDHAHNEGTPLTEEMARIYGASFAEIEGAAVEQAHQRAVAEAVAQAREHAENYRARGIAETVEKMAEHYRPLLAAAEARAVEAERKVADLRATIEHVEREVATVYAEITDGHFTKCNTAAEYILDRVRELRERDSQEARHG